MPKRDHLHRKAEAERSRLALQNTHDNREAKKTADALLDPGSPKIFRRINPLAPRLGAWVLFVVIAAVVCWMLWLLNKEQFHWLLPVAAGITLLPLAVYGVQLVRAQLDYKTYLQWLNNPGFPVNGWNRLGAAADFPAPYYWDDISVTISLAPGTTTENIRLAEDALLLFTTSAARAFYRADHIQSGASGDRRKRWTVNGLTASGSANGEVMGRLYYFLQRDLRSIHRQTACIDGVQLGFSKNIYHVKPVQLRGVGNT